VSVPTLHRRLLMPGQQGSLRITRPSSVEVSVPSRLPRTGDELPPAPSKPSSAIAWYVGVPSRIGALDGS
jgi:hypothetical protein